MPPRSTLTRKFSVGGETDQQHPAEIRKQAGNTKTHHGVAIVISCD